MFDAVSHDVAASSFASLKLVGVVCYYGKHYSTFFFHSKKKIWISFDDAAVTEVCMSFVPLVIVVLVHNC